MVKNYFCRIKYIKIGKLFIIKCNKKFEVELFFYAKVIINYNGTFLRENQLFLTFKLCIKYVVSILLDHLLINSRQE